MDRGCRARYGIWRPRNRDWVVGLGIAGLRNATVECPEAMSRYMLEWMPGGHLYLQGRIKEQTYTTTARDEAEAVPTEGVERRHNSYIRGL